MRTAGRSRATPRYALSPKGSSRTEPQEVRLGPPGAYINSLLPHRTCRFCTTGSLGKDSAPETNPRALVRITAPPWPQRGSPTGGELIGGGFPWCRRFLRMDGGHGSPSSFFVGRCKQHWLGRYHSQAVRECIGAWCDGFGVDLDSEAQETWFSM